MTKAPSLNKVVNSVEDLIGSTPMVRLGPSLKDIPIGKWLAGRYPNIKTFSLKSQIYAKLEFLNPGGSVKDRIGLWMVNGLEASGALKPGGTVVEATSGNTGAGLAIICARRGYRCVLAIPDKMSAEKINALRAYGADVVITPCKAKPETADHYTMVAKRLAKEIPGAVLAGQYHNPDNPKAHYESTGPEIWEQMEKNIDVFVAGIGTGGTLSGTGRFLKDQNPNIKVVAVDPYGSVYHQYLKTKVLSEVVPYLVEGVGEDEIPQTMDLSLPDEVVQVTDDEAFGSTHVLGMKEGLFTGGSCGLAFYGGLEYLYDLEQKTGKAYRAVILLPDSGSRYLSKVFNDTWLKEQKLKTGWNAQTQLGKASYLPGANKVEGVDSNV